MHLTLTPAGHLMMAGSKDNKPAEDGSFFDERITHAFADCPAAGITALAGDRISPDWPLSWLFWRDFGGRYLLQLCKIQPSGGDFTPLDPPDPATFVTLYLCHPLSETPPHAGG